MDVFLVPDVLLINEIGEYALRSELAFQEVHVSVFELFGERVEKTMRRFGENEQLPLMRFGLSMTFETVLVATLFLTHLTIPADEN